MNRLGFYGGGIGSGPVASGVYRWGADKLGISESDIKRLEQESARIVNKAIDNGLVGEVDRIPLNKDGTYNLKKTGDSYDVINHALFGYEFGDTVPRRVGLQLKEYVQWVGKPTASEIDILNNAAAFNLRKNAKKDQTAEDLILQNIAERNRKLESGETPVKGKDFFFNAEDVQMVRGE